jgi:hypothetical protein
MNGSRDFPLSRPLPPSVAGGEAGFIDFYQRYATFSWPWTWRRTAVFGAIGVFAALSFGLSHGVYMKDWTRGVAVGWRVCVANFVLLGAGPLLAASVRHLGLARRVEVALVIGAVAVGIVLTPIANAWAFGYHDREMAAHQHAQTAPKPTPTVPELGMGQWTERGLNAAYTLFFWFLASGGLALRPYLAEPKRWAEYERRQALEALSLQKSTADLRLAVLQAQVEPHFLFNTLASVRSLINSDPPRAAQTIEALADHLRATLPKLRADTGTVLSTLGEQFDICASYLRLMQLRLGERLTTAIELPKQLRDVSFPPLTLISLVENAIKHGAEPKVGTTHVSLTAGTLAGPAGARLEVTVADDGAGLKLGMGEGTGLTNIRAQLLTRFEQSAALELVTREDGGVIARLVLPLEAAWA